MLLIMTDYITQVCLCVCVFVALVISGALSERGKPGPFPLLVCSQMGMWFSVARFLVTQEKSQIFFKMQTTPTFTYWLKLKKMHQICIHELLGLWITGLQSFSLAECLVETV